MKKIAVLIVILIVFNLICSNYLIYAISEEPDSSSTEPDVDSDEPDSGYSYMSIEEYKAIEDEGKTILPTKQGAAKRNISLGTSDLGSAASKAAGTFVYLAGICARTMSDITNDGGFFNTESDFSAEKTGLFTVNSLIFNEYLLFNGKAYQKSTDLNPDVRPSSITENIDQIKERGATISKYMVYLGVAFSLPMIVYAIAKVAMAKKAVILATWKTILARWVLCFGLMILYQYVLVSINEASDVLVNGFWNMRVGMENNGYRAFEATVESSILHNIEITGGMTALTYTIEFVAIVAMQLAFLIKYAIRSFALITLFILAPIVIIVHSINLMLGKNSDILAEYFKTYIMFSFMQPLHAFFYLVFFFSLSEIAINVPAVGIILMYALYRSTQIIKAIFGWEIGSSILSFKK